jgi:hypothetical protein
MSIPDLGCLQGGPIVVGDVVYVALTVALFVLLAVVVRGAEKL